MSTQPQIVNIRMNIIALYIEFAVMSKIRHFPGDVNEIYGIKLCVMSVGAVAGLEDFLHFFFC